MINDINPPLTETIDELTPQMTDKVRPLPEPKKRRRRKYRPRLKSGERRKKRTAKYKRTTKLSDPNLTGSPNRRIYTYAIASQIAQSEGIKSKREYDRWWKYNMPARMSKRPDKLYEKRHGHFSWRDFLNKENPFPARPQPFVSYEKAKEFAHTLGFTSKVQWAAFAKSDKKPKNIPSRPDVRYQRSYEWSTWREFLGRDLNKKHMTMVDSKKTLLYVVRLPNRPFNVYKFGTVLDGRDRIIALHQQGKLQIVRLFWLNRIDDNWMSIIAPYTVDYHHGEDNEFAITNIAELINDLRDNYFTADQPQS